MFWGTRLAAAAVLFSLYPAISVAESVSVQTALRAPDPVRFSGEIRGRYESLDGQFRAGFDGSDQAFLLRSLLHAEADVGPVTLGAEIQDARAYLADDGTPLTSSFVDALDVLQLYVKVPAPGVLGAGSTSALLLGRQTIDIGSERQLERVDFANVIRAFTGLHAISTTPNGDELHVVFTALIDRRPSDRESVGDNQIAANVEQWNQRVWAVHYRRADAAPAFASDLWAEVFAYGLNEEDANDAPTANRRYVTPGVRLFRAPAVGRWDLDVEGSLRFGSRRATTSPEDTDDLTTRASQLLARLGYTFDSPWRPRVAFQYYWASGDKDPADDRFDQYERLFGGRRGDLNNTSLHGPLTPANVSAPSVRFDVAPGPRSDARLHYSAAFLASDTDSFVIARLRDPSGRSGDFIGHAIDARARYWLVPDALRLEVGASALVFGEFTRSVPGGPQGDRTLFGYTQLSLHF